MILILPATQRLQMRLPAAGADVCSCPEECVAFCWGFVDCCEKRFSTLQKHFANVLEPPLDAGTDRHILGLLLGALL
jgi:hypothetical protein